MKDKKQFKKVILNLNFLREIEGYGVAVNLRDQNISTLLKGDIETNKDLFPIMLKNLSKGTVDPLNRINIMHLASNDVDHGI